MPAGTLQRSSTVDHALSVLMLFFQHETLGLKDISGGLRRLGAGLHPWESIGGGAQHLSAGGPQPAGAGTGGDVGQRRPAHHPAAPGGLTVAPRSRRPAKEERHWLTLARRVRPVHHRPLGFADIAAKYRHCLEHAAVPLPAASAVIEAVRHLEDLPDVRELMRYLVPKA